MKQFINSFLLLTLIFTCGLMQPISVFANERDSNTTVDARADVIGWRYKTENGKLYKRLFNYTQDKWIGDWIPV